MTIHKSSAVDSGIMPDATKAGVPLVRTGFITTANDAIVSGDTLQMVPVPKGAKILDVIVQAALPTGFSGEDVGYGGDPDAFMDAANLNSVSGAGYQSMVGGKQATAGFLTIFTHNDTIDIALKKAPKKIPTSTTIKMAVYYTMTGTIVDES
jgi:hypothetical protein